MLTGITLSAIVSIGTLLSPQSASAAQMRSSTAPTAILQTTTALLNPKPPGAPNFDTDILQPLRALQAVTAQAEQTSKAAAVAASKPASAAPSSIVVDNSAQDARSAKIAAQRNTMYANTYDWGNCTFWVASQRGVPSTWGDADNWYASAVAAGWVVSPDFPVVGAIAQTTAGWAGHVALVTSVNDNGTVTVSEMNYDGFDLVDSRTTPASDWEYIY